MKRWIVMTAVAWALMAGAGIALVPRSVLATLRHADVSVHALARRAGAEERMGLFLEEMQEVCAQCGVTEVRSKVLMGDVAEQIVDYATEIRADLIIMGTHGYKGLEKIMFGSVADKVVRSALCPVTTINPYTCCTWDK